MEEAWIPGLGHVIGSRVPGLLPGLFGDAEAAARRPDSRGWTALHSAAHEDVDNLGRYLADIESRTLAGNTPLHLAVRAGHICWLPTLITPTTLDSQNNQGFTPLQLALIHRQWKAAAVLVAAGACLYSPDTPPSSPSLASLPEEEPGLPLMLLKGMLADRSSAGLVAQAMRWKDARGNTALHAAARAGRLEEVRRLLRAGADLHVANAAGATPLAVAQQHGHVQLVPLLDPSTSSLEMYGTPIHVAAVKGDAAAMVAQLAAGAQPDSYAPDGSSILTVAAQHGHTRVVAVLLAALVKKYGPENHHHHQQQQQQHEGQGQLQQRRPNAPRTVPARLVNLVAAAIVPLARKLEDSSSCAQLLGVVLDVLGLEVTQHACGVVKTQLQREWKQQPWQRYGAQDHESFLVEALVLGCLGAEARRLVPARLQCLLQPLAPAANHQQQQQQQQQEQQEQAEASCQRQQGVRSQLLRSLDYAITHAAQGDDQGAGTCLASFAELYLQQPGPGLTSSACHASCPHAASNHPQPQQAAPEPATAGLEDAQAQSAQGCTPDLALLVHCGVVGASDKSFTVCCWANVYEQQAELCRSREVQDALLSAWVAARTQPCPGLVAAAVAAVTASRRGAATCGCAPAAATAAAAAGGGRGSGRGHSPAGQWRTAAATGGAAGCWGCPACWH